MKKLFLFLFPVLFFGCGPNGLTKEQRKLYLDAHVQNSNYLMGDIFGNFERYRLVYREDTAYINKFEPPYDNCRRLLDLLNEKYENNKDSESDDWDTINKFQLEIFENIDKTFPSFANKKIPVPALEIIHEDSESQELKLAKYFSNCYKMVMYLSKQLNFSENSTKNLLHEKSKFINLLIPSDTAFVNESFPSITSISFFPDLESYCLIKEMKDVEFEKVDLSTGKFKVKIIGKKPKIIITYYNPRTVKEIDYEIIL